MKRKVFGFISLMMVLLLAACGGSPDRAAEQETEKDGEQATRIVETSKGEVEIPANPERVVTDFYLADLLALDVKPLGSTDFPLNSPYTKEMIDGIENIGTPVSMEKVLALKPDLIIMESDENYDQLSKIAPTVVIPYASEGDFYGEFRKIADLVNKKDAAEKWITSFEEKGAAAREKVAPLVEKGETFGLYELQGDKLWIFGDNWGRGGQIIYDQLQLSPPAEMQKLIKEGTQYKELSLEALPQYAADNMFVTTWSGEGSNEEKTEELKKSAIWTGLSAVKENKVYDMNFEDMYYADPYALEGQLDMMTEKIIESHQR
ncbi:hypothetical protein BTO28_13195 [Domibacillus epiphyticus]|uniref:Fe/B12 periplasmic-binding domain-containing protein n=2 Tax=Domibacillus epiphyticus TaxID=1714355 RepID=A0A1V2A5K4_9BACI|nr:hypothetical protein BTO28_13195 [Domibacillus epiphyticus]